MRHFYAAYEAIQRVNRLFVGISCVSIVLIVILTDWEALTRYFFRSPAMWTYPITSYLLLYSIYLAMGYTLQKGGHVSVEVVVEMLPPGPRRWLERLGHLLGLIFVLIFLQQSFRLFMRQLEEGQRDISTIAAPLAAVSLALPIGLTLMAITYVFVLVESFLRAPGELTVQEQQKAARGADAQID